MTRPRKKKPAGEHLLITEEPKTDWQRALAHIEDNYKLYIAGAVFVALCIMIGVLIRISATLHEQEIMTRYTEAALVENAQERLEHYQAIRNSSGKWTPEVLYRMAETAIEAGDTQAAEDAFQSILTEYPDSDFAINASDGTAFLAWNRGDLEAALAGYEQLVQKWPGEFIARRKYNDIAKLQEALERPADAIAAYRKQLEAFPNSTAAQQAEQALTALREKHPDLFPAEGESETSDPAMATDDAANTMTVSVLPEASSAEPAGSPEAESLQ